MTLKHIEKVRYFLKQLDNFKDYKSAKEYVSELKGYFGKELNFTLKIDSTLYPETYTSDTCLLDKKKIINFLERVIANDENAGEVCAVLDLIDESETLGTDPVKLEKFVTNIYLSYSNVIKFDNLIKSIATQYGALGIQIYTVDKTIVDSVVTQLKRYAATLCATPKKSEKTTSQQTININTTANANSSSNVNIDIDLAINIAREEAEDAGLPDEQFEQVMKKIEELEAIAKSKESKGKRWQKVKEVMRWLVEQGIQVASILVPVLATSIG